jgi:hypothetical protein
MEIKLATFNFKRDENRKYDQIVRHLNKPNESPIRFAFTTDYDNGAVPKCPHCRTYLFPQEVSKAMWCCKKGQMLSLYKPWTQPTDEYRNHCIGNFPDAKLFRLHSRALNLTFSFAAFGIKYGAVDQSFAPPYFMKVNGMPYWRMLFANNASEPPANPLHMYIYDSDYNIKDTLLPQRGCKPKPRAPYRSSRHSRRSRPNARRRSPRSILTESSRNAALMSQFASLATFKFVSIII